MIAHDVRPDGWHPQSEILTRYGVDELNEVDAWSVEAHLDVCGACRATLGRLAVDTPVAAIVATVARNLRENLPPQPARARTVRSRRRLLMMRVGPAVRGPYLLSVLTVLAGAALLDVVVGRLDGASTTGWLAALAPLLPLLGVALCYGPTRDPLYEATAATVRGGLHLLLWRTVATLLVSIPAAATLGVITGDGSGTVWILPALALAVGALAAGTVVELHVAAAVLGGGWALAVLLPELMGHSPVVLGPATQPIWALLAVLAAVVVGWRRNAYTTLTSRQS